ADAEFGALFGFEARMRRRRRVRDEALRITEIVGNIDEPQRIEKTEAGLLVAGHVEANEAAALFHLPTRKFVLRMARQPGVKHSRDFGMVLEVPGDGRRGEALALDP